MSGGVLTFLVPVWHHTCPCPCHTGSLCSAPCCDCRLREPPPSRAVPRIEGTEFIVRRKSDYVTTDTKDNK